MASPAFDHDHSSSPVLAQLKPLYRPGRASSAHYSYLRLPLWTVLLSFLILFSPWCSGSGPLLLLPCCLSSPSDLHRVVPGTYIAMASNATPSRPSANSATPEAPVRNALFSSPPRRERRNPSVTPRRFARFFNTPLGEGPSQHGLEGGHSSGSRMALSDVHGSTINSQPGRVKRKLFDNELTGSTLSLPPPEPLTKRTRTEPSAHPFSDENIPALSHRWQSHDLDEVCYVL